MRKPKTLKIGLHQLFVPIALICILLIYILRGNTLLQFEVVVIAGLAYLSIALVHHHFNKSLTLELIIEYILIAILALVILQGLLV